MPHVCDDCNTEFPDASEELLQGCPECGGNTFEYIPEGRSRTEQTETTDVEDPAQTAARDEIIDADEIEGNSSFADVANGLQSNKSVSEVAEEDRDVTDDTNNEDGPVTDEKLREELSDQFESIQIIAPGEYKLNLRKLYERQEHIVKIKEEGKYVIQMPEDDN